MKILRTEHSLKLSFTPLYMLDHSNLKICYLNARSLHKHVEDVRKNINYSATDILIFTETRFSPLDPVHYVHCRDGYMLFRNDIANYSGPTRPYGGTAVDSRVPLVDAYPYAHNINGIEFTVIKTISHPDLTIIGSYRSPKVGMSHLLAAILTILDEDTSSQNIIIGDFNVNWMVESERQSLHNVMVVENGYKQLISIKSHHG